MKYIWYACYGSNLKADRFKCYIEGGTCTENGRSYGGCRDKSLWIDSRIKKFPGKMFFANSSGSWEGKGVAFYDPEASGETIMRLYKITSEQLDDIQGQEGPGPRWYGRKVELGIEDDCPIITITNSDPIKANKPSDVYLSLIRKALVEECGISPDKADEYLDTCLQA